MLRWEHGRDLYIDCSIINPKCQKWRVFLSEGGVGAAADEWAKKKVDKYRNKIDPTNAIFLPFIMEVQGGFGKDAADFMI